MEKKVLVSALSGSRAYGTNVENSDYDIRGIFIASKREKTSPFGLIQQVDYEIGKNNIVSDDILYYELSRYIELATSQNPNVIELIWTHEKDILQKSPEWEILHKARFDFLSRNAKGKFLGFSKSVRMKMENRNNWHNKEQIKPIQKNFLSITGSENNNIKKIPEQNIILADAGNGVLMAYNKKNGKWFDDNGNIIYSTEFDKKNFIAYCRYDHNAYKKEKLKYNNFLEWQSNRNIKRTLNEIELGYDPKEAGHLIRFLREGLEILTEGIINVRRPDAQELLAIRKGEYSKERILSMADELEEKIKLAYEKTPLPSQVNQEIISSVAKEIYESSWSKEKFFVPKFEENDTMPPKQTRFFIIDTESGGLSKEEDKRNIVEIAAIEMINGKETGNVFHSYINPQTEINPMTTKIHNITDKFLQNKPLFEDVYPEFLKFIGDSPLVAHNIIADYNFLKRDINICGFKMFTNPMYCSQKISNELFPGKQSIGLDTLCDILKINKSERERGHSALTDCVLLKNCLQEMMDNPKYEKIKKSYITDRMLLPHSEKKKLLEEECIFKITIEENTLFFDFKSGERKEILINKPEDYVFKNKGNIVLVLPNENERRPDNPIGPALITIKNGEINEVWVQNGERVTPGSHLNKTL